MIRNFKIFTKVFVSHIAVGLVSILSISLAFYFLFQNALIQRTIDQLSSINILKKNQIDHYFQSTRKNLEFQLSKKNDITRPGEAKAGKRAGPASLASIEQTVEQLKRAYDFESILVVDSHYRKIVSTLHDSLLTNMVSVAARRHQQMDQFQILEAGSYLPTRQTIMVYVLPFTMNEFTGFIFIEDKFEKIQTILQETTGMGNTGESYLIGSDFKMRSVSRFFPDQPPGSIAVNTPSAEKVFTGVYQGEVTFDYRGRKVLSFYRKIDSAHVNWALISEIDYDEAMKPVARWRNYLVMAAGLILMTILVMTFFIADSIARPILYLKRIIAMLSAGVFPTGEVKVVDKSEVGQIARAISELIDGLKRTTQFADEIGAGNFDAPFTTLSDKDTLGLALIRMRDRLRTLSDEQVQLVREKAAALLEGQENERKRIVQDLHDGVGQLLTAIRLQVAGLDRDEKSNHEIMTLVNETIEEVKRISYNLMPNALVDFGLEAALEGLCDNVRKSASISIDFKFIREVEHRLSFETSIAVFRIVQEGFNNILKHAGASRIELYVLDNEQQLYFVLKDNGKGFEEGAVNTKGFGLRSMKERAKLLHGNLEIHSSPGQGTELEVTIPTQHP